MIGDSAIDVLRRPPFAPSRVRQVALPPAARARGTLSRVDNEDAFLVKIGPGQERTGVWAGIAPGHRQVVRYVLEQGTRRRRP
jgi:hypothetical protein